MPVYSATVNADGSVSPPEINVKYDATGASVIIYSLAADAMWTKAPGGIVVSAVGTSPDGSKTASWPTGTASAEHHEHPGKRGKQIFTYTNNRSETFRFKMVERNVGREGGERGDNPGADPVIQNEGGGGDVPPYDRGRD
ncbi:MAG TPA: hypothetical protein VHK90_07695 [Thermoanaerobaculia bacterium]|nr:hypothetical protein [Thermoanaerobaculia bacterium]